jgi:hypothetical protein
MENLCPKCGTQKLADACSKCGLVFKKFNPSVLIDTPSQSLQNLWLHTEQHWEEVPAHALFLERALVEDQAGFAARCYRTKGNDPMATAQLVRIQTRIMQSLMLTKSDPQRMSRGTRFALTLFFILFVFAMIIFALL